jgi:hypothetical protein
MAALSKLEASIVYRGVMQNNATGNAETLEVSRQEGLWDPRPSPPRRFELPMELTPGGGLGTALIVFLMLIVMFLVGIICISLVWISVTQDKDGLATRAVRILFMSLVLLGIFLRFGSGVAFVADVLRFKTVLLIAGDRMVDFRCSAAPVFWRNVTRARFVHGGRPYGVLGVRLTLRAPMEWHHDLLREGAFFLTWRLRPNEIFVSLSDLSMPRTWLEPIVRELVLRHGGVMSTPS